MRGPSLRLVSVNDVYTLENFPRLRTLVRHHAETEPADAFLTTLAGDFLAPSLLSSLDRGVGMVDCLNALPIQCVCFGNHEQDVPFDALIARTQQYRGTWLNTNMPDFRPELPATKVVTVQGAGTRAVRVGLLGVLTEDPMLYPPHAFGGLGIAPAHETALRVARELIERDGCACVVALTHQSLARDRDLARAAGHTLIPLILGGHEHEPHLDPVEGAWIIKTGMDAVQAAVIDLTWPAEAPAGAPDLPSVRVRVEPVRDFAEDPALRAMVDTHLRAVAGLQAATLLTLKPDETLSSVGTRARQTSVGALIASSVRTALHVDACLINGGGIRGNREYHGAFTYGDLEAELPFANEVVVAQMPGRVVREAVAASRAQAPRPAFLQVDDAMTVDPNDVVTHVAGAPLEDAKEYCVATVRVLFDGMDGIDPLARFARENPGRIPRRDSGRELKLIVVEAFMRALWRELGSFDQLDVDRGGEVSEDELRAAIDRTAATGARELFVEGILRVMDLNGDRKISRDEARRVGRGGA